MQLVSTPPQISPSTMVISQHHTSKSHTPKCSMCPTPTPPPISSNETSSTSGLTYADIDTAMLLPSPHPTALSQVPPPPPPPPVPPQPPYYLCTVTCCDSASCVKASAAAALDLIVATSASNARLNGNLATSTGSARLNGNLATQQALLKSEASARPYQVALARSIICRTTPTSCPICIKLKQITSSPGPVGYRPPEVKTPPIQQQARSAEAKNVSPTAREIIRSAEVKSFSSTAKEIMQRNKFRATRSTPNSPIPQYNVVHRIESPEVGPSSLSPELSSCSPPMLGNASSYTDYTNEARSTTPGCSSAGGRATRSEEQQLFSFDAPLAINCKNSAILCGSDYQFYYSGAENHGFFRKAVPALPIPIAILFCIFNLVLPGSGTLFASVSIILGSRTEYGLHHTYRAFLICFLSSILQFTTAIFVFGWVWSIMWGIVFIKNSLRYGSRRDIHTMSLC